MENFAQQMPRTSMMFGKWVVCLEVQFCLSTFLLIFGFSMVSCAATI